MSYRPPLHELEFEAVRSRGPGGQNVNKTNSAAILRWNLRTSSAPDVIKSKLFQKLANKLTEAGELMVRSEEQRDLEQNRKTCIDKLNAMIAQALFVPKKRIKTKPGKSAVRKRLDSKRKHSEKKSQRGAKDWD